MNTTTSRTFYTHLRAQDEVSQRRIAGALLAQFALVQGHVIYGRDTHVDLRKGLDGIDQQTSRLGGLYAAEGQVGGETPALPGPAGAIQRPFEVFLQSP